MSAAELPLASWADPDHPLHQEFEEQMAAIAVVARQREERMRLENPGPPIPAARAIAEALRALATPRAVGYEIQERVYQLLEDADLGGGCAPSALTAPGSVCARGTKRCPVRHRPVTS